MKYVEERHAKKLHEELARRLTEENDSVSVEGAGVHWQCEARRGAASCSTACFSGPEYLTSFLHQGEELAVGRTNSSEATMDAIKDWLANGSVERLYQQFSFVDQNKRALLHIRNIVVEQVPGLAAPDATRLESQVADIYYLWFHQHSRSTKVSFYGKNKHPDAVFCWEMSPLFEFRAKNTSRLASVIRRWVQDAAPPSQMRQEFPWLKIGELADYYEQGQPLLGEFLNSWDSIEKFYNYSGPHAFLPAARHVVAQMRAKGYDRTLRAGQSMWTLILSRSHRHGLQGHQPWISFDFAEEGMDVRAAIESGKPKHFSFATAELSPEVEALLKQLQGEKID